MQEIIINIALIVYFGINIFMLGLLYEEYRTLSRIGVALFVFGGLAFGSLIWLAWLLYEFAKKVEIYFQLNFFWRFYITKDKAFFNVDPKHLQTINKYSASKGNRLNDRIFKYATKLMNERNKFTYDPNIPTYTI